MSLKIGKETILVVDDEDHVRSLLKTILSRDGYTVVEAEDGSEALEILNQQTDTFDLLVTDVRMPNMNGIELVHASRPKRPTMKILLVSGSIGEFSDQIQQLGSNVYFIEKPFERAHLLKKVREVLEAPVTPAARTAGGG